METNDMVIPVMEHFYTIQGEGYHQGKAAYFIRTAGCDVGCVWCDVKESWDAAQHSVLSVTELAHIAAKYPTAICVVTGGEPLMYPLDALTDALHARHLQTHLETSGAYPLSGTWDWICFSPKKYKAPLREVAVHANELKVVIYHKSDFLWAEENRKLVSQDCLLFLQPEWSRRNEMMPLIIDYTKRHPEWQISLQLHKYMDID